MDKRNPVPWWVTDLPEFEPAEFEADPDYWQLLEEVGWLRQHVLRQCPADEPITKLFLLAYTDNAMTDSRLPSRRGLKAARDAFADLPADEQQRILEGWKFRFPADVWTPAQVDEFNVGKPVRQVLMPSIGADGKISGNYFGIYAEHRGPVHLCIDVGAGKRQVMQELDELWDAIERDWDQLNGRKERRPPMDESTAILNGQPVIFEVVHAFCAGTG